VGEAVLALFRRDVAEMDQSLRFVFGQLRRYVLPPPDDAPLWNEHRTNAFDAKFAMPNGRHSLVTEVQKEIQEGHG
jgi:hypothetical protein